jgi:hypothetical protein
MGSAAVAVAGLTFETEGQPLPRTNCMIAALTSGVIRCQLAASSRSVASSRHSSDMPAGQFSQTICEKRLSSNELRVQFPPPRFDSLRSLMAGQRPPTSKHGIDFPRPGALNRDMVSLMRKLRMPQHVRTWAVILVAAAVMAAPALRSGADASAHQGQRVSKGATSHRKGRSRASARLAPSLVRKERAMIEPPHPTQNSPERVGHAAVDTRSDRAGALCDDLLKLPRPPLRC